MVAEQLRALGLPAGAIIVVHTSYRAVGPIDGGPAGLIAALGEVIGRDGTLVMPAMSDDDDVPFDVARTPCRAMGVVADTFWRLDGVVRSDHHASFAARGAQAAAITAPHAPAPPHGLDSPVGRAAALGGFVLLLGVDHSANTTVHAAEALARVPYRARKHFTAMRDGVPVRVEYEETDHCCRRFAQLDEWLRARGLQRDGTVGRGAARLMRGSDVLRVAVEALTRDPFTFLHRRGGGCDDCDAAWASVTNQSID